MERDILSTNRKALQINLNSSIYGTIAEIGGGQEVARQFFQAGSASGTIAKSISAYDKLFSDRLYNNNKPGKYVSEGRLSKMLHAEYAELVGLLAEKREISTSYFAFADTVATLNFNKDRNSSSESNPSVLKANVSVHWTSLMADLCELSNSMGTTAIVVVVV